jgi:hypothetical protein
VAHGNTQRGQALPVVLVTMTLILLLAGGVTVGISAVIRRQAPDRNATRVDLAAQNTVAAVAASLTASGSECRAGASSAASQPLLDPQSPASETWNLSPDGTWQTGQDGRGNTTLTYEPAGAHPPTPTVQQGTPPIGVALARQGQTPGWGDYSATADLVPGDLGQDASVELDVRDQESSKSWYFLAMQGPSGAQRSAHWVFGRAEGGQPAGSPFATGSLPSLGRTQQVTVAMEVVGGMITAKISGAGDPVVRSHTDTRLGAGTVAIRIAARSTVQVSRVEVDQRSSLPGPTMVTLPAQVPDGPDRYGCQRLDQVGTADELSQRRVSLVTSCPRARVATAQAIPIPAGDHRKVWLTLAWPEGQSPPGSLGLTAGSCPSPGGSADCSLQKVTLQQGWAQQITPVSVVADCSNPTENDLPYHLYVPTDYRGGLPPVNVRWAPDGQASVYTTVAWLGRQQRYQETDFVLRGSSTALTYEGGLG